MLASPRSTPARKRRKNGSTSSVSTWRASSRPIAPARARLSARAGALGLQPSSAAASRIRARVASPTPRRPFMANETAAEDTPARRATSSMVGRRRARLGVSVIGHAPV